MNFQIYIDKSNMDINHYNLDNVLDALNIKNKPSSIRYKCNKIRKKISENYPKLQELIHQLDQLYDTKINVCKHLIIVLYNMFESSSRPFSYPMSNKTYKNYIKKYKNNTIKADELNKLKKMLYIKFCRCIKSNYIKNISDDLFKNIKPTNNPYAFCTSSIYLNRGFKTPPSAARNCRKTFKWYNY